MLGKPKDVEGQCNAWLSIADDYGDNSATVRCQLDEGHEGLHEEKYKCSEGGSVRIIWEKDHSVVCEIHGRQIRYKVPPENPEEEIEPECDCCQLDWMNQMEEESDLVLKVFVDSPEIREIMKGSEAFKISYKRLVSGVRLAGGGKVEPP
ncbi:MAG: hypothetical protein GF334_06540, partial [Candidatus Altiarchaeales archaeon]|nr:hypothetical protein [Candidatus Altiarchaeales archaeon]